MRGAWRAGACALLLTCAGPALAQRIPPPSELVPQDLLTPPPPAPVAPPPAPVVRPAPPPPAPDPVHLAAPAPSLPPAQRLTAAPQKPRLTLIQNGPAEPSSSPSLPPPAEAPPPPTVLLPPEPSRPEAAASDAPAAKAATPPPRPRRTTAVIQALDKVTAESLRFAAPVNQPVRYKDLVFTVHACEDQGPTPAQRGAAAHLEIDSQPRPTPEHPNPPARQVFSGWMFAGAPGLHPLEHPVYDAWLIACRADSP